MEFLKDDVMKSVCTSNIFQVNIGGREIFLILAHPRFFKYAPSKKSSSGW